MTPRPTTETAWSRLSSDLRRFIRRRVADDHVADDLVQETFLRVHRGIGRLGAEERLAAWVYQIARNVIRDHYRERERGPAPLPEGEATVRDEPADDVRERAAVWLDELIGELPRPYREAVRLAEVEGLPQRELAERLGLSLSGAKSRVQRGRRMLREVLERCCTFHFDRRGNLLDCDPKPDRTVCRDCDAGPGPA